MIAAADVQRRIEVALPGAEIMVRGDEHDRSAPPGSADSFLCLGPGWATVSNTPFRRHKTWVFEGGISTPLIIGYIAQNGNFAPGLTYIATVAVIGALAYILMIGKLERVE